MSPGGTPGNKHADETEKPAVEEDLYHDAPVMTVFTYMHYDHGQKQYFCLLIVGFDRILMYVYVYTETVFTAVTLTASFSEQIHSNPQQNTDYMILLLKYWFTCLLHWRDSTEWRLMKWNVCPALFDPSLYSGKLLSDLGPEAEDRLT